MVKTYIAIKGLSGNGISAGKCSLIELDETQAQQLVKDGYLAEYYESDAIPTYDITAMGAMIGEKVKVDARGLYKALENGIVKVKFQVFGNEFDWNVLAIKIKQGSETVMVFSGSYLFNVSVAFVEAFVYEDAIRIEAKLLESIEFSF